ncbi:MAG TPA: ABC transporter permease [Bryobacteraceae bacterium]|nr:ABC transporter permease [Bryobacteraceae bacterium]
MAWRPNAIKIYRGLLFAFPTEFRHEYGAEMEQCFRDRLENEPGWRLWLDTVADVAVSAVREHWHILWADVRYGFRMLAADLSFTLAALLALALGIGATTAVFSVVNAVLIRSLPYGDPGRLVYLWTPNRNFQGIPDEMSPSYADFYSWRKMSRSFSSLAMVGARRPSLESDAGVEKVAGAAVTANFFRTLEAQPEIGHTFDADDDEPGHEHVAVISDALWRGQFGGRADVIGKEIELDSHKYTMIGVMPAAFGYPHQGDIPYAHTSGRTEIWIPMTITPQEKTDRQNWGGADAAIGRLKPGVGLRQAQREMSAIEARLNPLYPPMFRDFRALVKPFSDTIFGPVRQILWLLLGAVGLVLLIACTNVATLLMARITRRIHEMGVRTALGAERARLMRQILTEAVLLSCAGGSLGILLAFASVRILGHINPGDIPRFGETSVDTQVLLVSLAVSIGTGLLFGILPALSASRVNIADLLKQGGSARGVAGTSNRLRQALVTIQVALSVVLLVGAGLLIRSYLKLAGENPGFSSSSLTFSLPVDEHYRTPEQRGELYQRLLEQVRRLPGVQAVGAASGIPLDHYESVSWFQVEGYSNKPSQTVNTRTVTPGYFNAIGISMKKGRAFGQYDVSARAGVVIVNQAFARTYFPGRDAIGGHIRFELSNHPGGWSTVVGVVNDVRHSSLEEAPRPAVFQPAWVGLNNHTMFAVRAAVPSGQLLRSLRSVLRRLDPALAFDDVHTMGERIWEADARRRFETFLLAAFAGLAVFLAAIGLYGLMSYSVRQRTSELGVRMALGATRPTLLLMVLREGIVLVGSGLVLGLATAFGLTRLIGSWLYGVAPTDPVTFLFVLVFLVLLTVCACLIPGCNATRVDPASALRYE